MSAIFVFCLVTSTLGTLVESIPRGIITTASAQSTNTASLTGTVVDVQGAVVPDVNITAIGTQTGLQRQTAANNEGYFSIPFLKPGSYTITAEMPGFATVTVYDVVLQVSINSNVQITLRPQGVTEAVVVREAQNNAIDISNATVKHSVTTQQIEGLPVFTSTLGRTVLDQLAFLVPGVTPTSAGGTSGNRGEDISINGSRPSSISFNFEGGDNNDHENNRAASPMPNPDALKEFTVVTNSYQADLGRSAGGVINATAKSGSNDFHGNARFFWHNEALNARGFFDAKRDKDRLNTFGWNIGGPVRIPWLYNGKDRTHFFVDHERTRADNSNTFSRDLLTIEERAGNFSQTVPLLRDPATGLPCTAAAPQGCFPGSVIPASRISPIAKAYLELIPIPNNPALGPEFFTKQFANGQRNDQLTLRVDQRISSSDQLSGTYFLTYTDNESASTTTLPIGSMQTSHTENHNFVLRETHSFSPNTVNEFTATVTRYLDGFTFPSPLSGTHPSDFGITGVEPQTDNFLLPSSVVITGTGVQVAAGGGNRSYKTAWQIKDDISHLTGNHGLKFGGEARGFIYNKYLANNNGGFNFSNANANGTGNAVADFLLGIPNSFSQSTGNVLYPRQRAYYVYGMDDWKPQPNLTINLGLRYELTPPLVDENDQFSVFRPGVKSQRLPQAPLGLLFVGDPDPILGTVPRGTYPVDKNNFAPRLGVAYSPAPESGFWRGLFGKGKTAIRAGWGIFYDQTYGFSATQYSFTQPFSVSLSLNSAQIAAAGGNFANPFGLSANPFPLNLAARTFSGTPALQPFDPTFRTAYTYQYNLTIQRELPAKLLLEMAYVGNNSFKLNRERQLNIATVGPGSTTTNLQARRIYSQFASIPSQESTGRARYDGLQARLTRRFQDSLSFDLSYVFSKALDNGSNPQNSQLAGSDHLRWARSSFDRRHNFVISYTYAIPALKRDGFLGRVLDGWQIGGITSWRSGLPLDITQSPDPALNGYSIGNQGNPDLVGQFVPLDPRNVRTFIVNGVQRTGNFAFDPTAFRLVPLTDLRNGTLGRNSLSGPAYSNWSASFIKRTRIFERHLFEIRADIDNLLNHANFYFPGRTINFATFGAVTSASSPRTVQLSARYSF